MATFNFTFDPGTTLQQMVGFEIAGRVWSQYLTDNVTLNIQVGVSSGLSSNVIGGSLPGMRASQSYIDYRNALNNGPKSADDNTAINNLSGGTSFQTSFEFLDNGTIQTRVENKESLNMTRAVAKAAGINLTDGTTALDGYILFSDLSNATTNGQPVRWSYDYTRSNPQAANTLDFLSTATHELGHILGFVSGIDQPGWLNLYADGTSSQTPGTSSQNYIDGMRNRLQFVNPLDLYRYSQSSSTRGLADMTYGSLAGTKFFSLNKGTTVIAQFSTGADTTSQGDGYQASHWKTGTTAMMSPTLSLNQRLNPAALDLQALDVIGWDIASTGIGTSINLSTLQTQSQQSLALRAGQSSNVTTWINNNFTASPTKLVANRDQAIYTMMQNSSVYDLTRVSAPGSTGWTTRQTLAQMFQQQGLFEMVDELVGASDASSDRLIPPIAIAGEILEDNVFANPSASTPQLINAAIASLSKIIQFHRETLSASVPQSPTPLQKITIEVSAQTVVTPENPEAQLGRNLAFSIRDYDSGLPRSTRFSAPTVSTESNHFPVVSDESLFADLTAS